MWRLLLRFNHTLRKKRVTNVFDPEYLTRNVDRQTFFKVRSTFLLYTSLHKIYCKIIYFRNIHPSPRQYLTNKQKKKKKARRGEKKKNK